MPLCGARLGVTAATICPIMATFALATFVVRLAMPVLVRRLRASQVIVTALGIAGSSYVLFPFVASVPLLMALSFVLGLGLGCAQPAIMSLLYLASPRGRPGEAVRVRTPTLPASHTFIPHALDALTATPCTAPAF